MVIPDVIVRYGAARTCTIMVIVFGLIGYTAWAATLPSSPVLEISGDATKFGSMSVVILTPLMAVIAPWIGLQQD